MDCSIKELLIDLRQTGEIGKAVPDTSPDCEYTSLTCCEKEVRE